MSTFNFYKSDNSDKMNRKSERPEVIRKKILEAYDRFTEMTKSDLKIREMISEEKFITGCILKHYNELKQLTETDDNDQKVEELNKTMSILDQQSELLKRRKVEYLEGEFKWLHSNYPEIFTLITGTEPPARETFESVLNAFLESEKGRIDRKSAMKNGLESLRKRHNLPNDFFDYGKLDQFC